MNRSVCRVMVAVAGLAVLGMTATLAGAQTHPAAFTLNDLMQAPEEVGGVGADYVSYALALMEVAAADGALSTIVSIQNSIMVSGILREGTEACGRIGEWRNRA